MVIESCDECKHYEVFGHEVWCFELSRQLKSKTYRIPKDCPLDDDPCIK
jgi:hypothetical protein